MFKRFKSMPKKSRFSIIAVVVIAGIVFIGVVNFLTPPAEEDQRLAEERGAAQVPTSRVSEGRSGELPPDYDQILREQEEVRAREAIKEGQSYMPPAPAPEPKTKEDNAPKPVDPVGLSEEDFPSSSPVSRVQKTAGEMPGEAGVSAERVELKLAAIEALFQNDTGKGQPVKLLFKEEVDARGGQASQDQGKPEKPQGKTSGTAGDDTGECSPNIGRGLCPGDMLIGVLDTGINSDTPSPIRVLIVNGPLKGATLMGDFQLQGERVVASMNTITWKDKTARFEAVLVDPDLKVTSLQGDIDRHWFYRWGSLFMAGFLSAGYELKLREGGEQTIVGDNIVASSPDYDTSDYAVAGVGKMAEAALPRIEDNFNRPPTITVPEGQMVGVMIVAPQNITWLPDMGGMLQY